jgi:hypothetical protein
VLCGHRGGFGEDNEIQKADLVESSALSARAGHPKDHPGVARAVFPVGTEGMRGMQERARRKYGAAMIVETLVAGRMRPPGVIGDEH